MTNLLDKKQAAQYLGVSLRTIDYFRTRENLPFHVIGGKLIRFAADELECWALGRGRSNGSDEAEQMEGKSNGTK